MITVGNLALKAEHLPEAEIRPRRNVVVPIARKLSIFQLTERTCKWPIGDPGGKISTSAGTIRWITSRTASIMPALHTRLRSRAVASGARPRLHQQSLFLPKKRRTKMAGRKPRLFRPDDGET